MSNKKNKNFLLAVENLLFPKFSKKQKGGSEKVPCKEVSHDAMDNLESMMSLNLFKKGGKKKISTKKNKSKSVKKTKSKSSKKTVKKSSKKVSKAKK